MSGAPAPAPRLLTAEDLLAGGERYDHCELWDGVLVVHEPESPFSSHLGVVLAARLHEHVQRTNGGWVFGEQAGFVLRRRPDRLLVPDVAYISRERLPSIGPDDGFPEMAPDFCVEVRSRTDSWAATVEKCGRWIAHGVRVVWAVDPKGRQVLSFHPDRPPIEAGPGDVVDAAPVLPDFRVAVDDLFADRGA